MKNPLRAVVITFAKAFPADILGLPSEEARWAVLNADSPTADALDLRKI
jgi:hypothetical protein